MWLTTLKLTLTLTLALILTLTLTLALTLALKVWLTTLKLLLWKRLCCMRRDRKAFLSQQILPVALVALAMLVLLINMPLAGPRIEMSAALFSPTELVTNLPADDPLAEQLHSPSLSLKHMEHAIDSDAISRFLLATEDDAGNSRESSSGLRVEEPGLRVEEQEPGLRVEEPAFELEVRISFESRAAFQLQTALPAHLIHPSMSQP